ncbi:PucR family transcriptional regulator [Mycolicibacterium helvum]|uniref:Polyketide synthase regulator n=1 Tax=Mycolicibacterium helvum TaxID=1534349 RepID=A0A7I7T6B7_9MYCO|nr:PucR family transcriptional regulator ligand-binding domain-containing protein [Mycolicibacterium helvum]BBY64540.1 polyketide synthase regulator [Mycolicibacterium helvum]
MSEAGMSGESSLSVAAVLMVPPLDHGSVVAGRRGLTREVRWVDIIHAPAEDFVRAGDLVLTTGADISQPGVRDFLVSLFASAAAGVVLSPPPEVAVDELLELLIPLAEQHACPFVLLPWEIAFADVQKSLLPLLSLSPSDQRFRMAVGRSECAGNGWTDLAGAFADSLQALARSADIAVRSSVTDDLVMSHFASAPTASTITELVACAQQLSGLSDDLVSWALLPAAYGPSPAPPATGSSVAVDSTVGARQFADVLRHHPRSMAMVLQTLQPLIDYDTTRRGQLVHTLEIVLNEATNTSAAARALYLNRHSLLYRIKLIEELTGLSLKNPADRFQLEVSVRVHQINEARADGMRRG